MSTLVMLENDFVRIPLIPPYDDMSPNEVMEDLKKFADSYDKSLSIVDVFSYLESLGYIITDDLERTALIDVIVASEYDENDKVIGLLARSRHEEGILVLADDKRQQRNKHLMNRLLKVKLKPNNDVVILDCEDACDKYICGTNLLTQEYVTLCVNGIQGAVEILK